MTPQTRPTPGKGTTLKSYRSRSSEDGASLVEFALILPIFMALVLGLFTGGAAYERKLAVTGAAREGARFGATVPVNGDIKAWLFTVAKAVKDGATGDLNDGVDNRRICIAYVYPVGTSDNDRTSSFTVTTGSFPASAASITVDNALCKTPDGSADYDDGIADTSQRRVDVVSSRTSKIEVLLFSMTRTLSGTSVTRFEAVPAS